MYSTVQSFFFFLSVAGENIIAYLFVDVISFFFYSEGRVALLYAEPV